MSASRIRARLRKARQADNKAFLSAEQKKENPKAAAQFIIFARKYDGRYYKLTFEDFVQRFPEQPRESPRRPYIGPFVNSARAFIRQIMRRRSANKRARKQRVSA